MAVAPGALSPEARRAKIRRLEEFANAFRDINRRVCIDTYTNFHFTARFGNHPDAGKFVPAVLLTALNRLHAAVAQGRELPDSEKREVFEAHFLHEQEHVVGPAIRDALAVFNWPLLRFIALRPAIRFAYFPGRRFFWFRDFASRTNASPRGSLRSRWRPLWDGPASSRRWPAIGSCRRNFSPARSSISPRCVRRYVRRQPGQFRVNAGEFVRTRCNCCERQNSRAFCCCAMHAKVHIQRPGRTSR